MQFDYSALSPLGRKIIVLIGLMTAGIAAVAFAASYSAIYDWVQSLEMFPEIINKTIPFLLDAGFIIAQLAAILMAVILGNRFWPFVMMAVSAGMTLWINYQHADGNTDAQIIAILPPAMMMIAFEMDLAIVKQVMRYLGKPIDELIGPNGGGDGRVPGHITRSGYGQLPNSSPAFNPAGLQASAAPSGLWVPSGARGQLDPPTGAGDTATAAGSPAPSKASFARSLTGAVRRALTSPLARRSSSGNKGHSPASSPAPSPASEPPSSPPPARPAATPPRPARREVPPGRAKASNPTRRASKTRRQRPTRKEMEERRAKAEAYVLQHLREHGMSPSGAAVAAAVGVDNDKWGRTYLEENGERLVRAIQMGEVAPVVQLRARQ